MRYGFRRRLALLLCIALTVHPAEVFAARSLAANTEEVTEQTTDVINDAAYSQASDGISTLEREQLREKIGAEGIENINPDTAADDAVEAELSEKAAYDAELDRYKVDDSSKLDDAHVGGSNADDYQDEKDPAGIERDGIGEPASNKFDFTIGGTQYNDSLDVAVSKAAQEGKPVYFNTNSQIDVKKTIEIPSGKRVELHFNGVSVHGLNIGQNPIFRVSDKATLRIYGTDNASTSAKITGGRNGAIIAGDESTVELNNLNLYKNRSGENGGALFLGSKVNCRLNNVRLEANYAGSYGGAIYVYGSTTNVHLNKDTVFVNNSSYGNGGAVYISGSKVNFFGPAGGMVTVKNNESEYGYGGALYSDASNFSLCSFRFEGNKSKFDGGAVYFNGSGNGLANCEIEKNSARYGGGVYINAGTCGLSGVSITDNSCSSGNDGGGVYVDSRYNLSTSGKVIIRDNHSASSADTDLFLQEGWVTTSYLKVSSYNKGSKIGIGVSSWKEGRQISYGAGNYDPRVFFCNKGNWYVALGQNKDSSIYRYLYLTKSRSDAHEAAVQQLDNRSTNKSLSFNAGFNYTAGDGQSYPVVYGYASSPNHTDEERDIVNKYYYSDGYFFDDPKTYNPHLSTFAMNLAMASADSNICAHDDYSYKFDNVKSVLMGIGCDESSVYISPSYTVKPTDSSIGVAIGKKEITSGADNTVYTLIPIAVRSYNYEKEWASNMTLDGDNTSADNGEHSGFRDARTKVMNAIKDYIAGNDLESSLKAGRVKFFITGFSRGSAVANLTGAALVNTYGVLSEDYKPNDVFAYCMAVPAGGTDTDDASIKSSPGAYYCIHNVINKVDLTPMVGPEAMGFKRYGVDHYMPGDSAGSVKKVAKRASEANGSYPVTLFYDNNAYMTNSSAYAAKRPDMLRQLTLVNDDIHFVDYFKETDLDLGKSQAISEAIIGALSYLEAEPVKLNEVSNSKLTLEEWLPRFYSIVQSYNTLAADKTLTRKNYSSLVVRAGKSNPSAGEKDWSKKGSTAQDTFRNLVILMLSKTPSEKADLGLSFSGLKNKFDSKLDMLFLFEQLINSNKGWDYSEDRQQSYLDMFWNMLNDNKYGQKGIQDAVTDKAELASLENSFPTLMSIIMRIARQDYNDPDHEGHMRLIGTFANNTEAILQGHVPEIALAWLRANDDYYNAETKSYVWKAEEQPVDPTIELKGVETGNIENVGECRGTLECSDPGAEIFYTVTGPNNVTSQPSLYTKGKPIIFAAPSTGEADYNYTLKTWIYRSRAVQDGKVDWGRYPESDSEEMTFTVKVKPEEPRTVTLKYKMGESGEEKALKTSSVYKGAIIRVSRSDFPCDKSDSDWYFDSFKITAGSDTFDYKDSSISWLVDRDSTVTAVFKPRINAFSFDEDFIDSVLKPQVEPTAKALVMKMSKGGMKYRNTASDTWIKPENDGYIDLSWSYLSDGHWKKVGGSNPVAEFGTKYRVYFTISDKTFKVPLANTVYQYIPDISSQPDTLDKDRSGNVEGFIEFEPTAGKKEILSCLAGDGSLSVSVNASEDRQKVIGSLKKAMPTAVGNITTNDGITLSGCNVGWDYDDVPEDLNSIPSFRITGDIEDVATKIVEDHDWTGWKERSGLDKLKVAATVYLTEAARLVPPTASPAAGIYTLNRDPVELDEDGNLKVTLKDPNDEASGSSIMYTLKDSNGTAVNEQVDSPYTGPISIPAPDPGETKTYILSANCITESEGYAASDTVEWTYVLKSPAVHKLKVFADDYNKPADIDKIESMSDGDFAAVYDMAVGDSILLDGEELFDKAYTDHYCVVSWNAVSKEGDTEIKEDIPDSSDDFIWYTMPDKDVYLRALYAPTVSLIDVGVDLPETGYFLPEHPYIAQMNIGDRSYEIDPDSVNIAWTLSQNGAAVSGAAEPHTGYTAGVSVSADNLRVIDYDEYGDVLSKPLGMKYYIFDDVSLYVSSDREEEKQEVSGYIISEDDKGLAENIEMIRNFPETGKASFIGIDVPEGITLSWNGTGTGRYETQVKPALPGSVNVYVTDDSCRTLPVHWLDVNSADIDGMDDKTVLLWGYCVIPDIYDYDKDEEGEPFDPAIYVTDRGEVRYYLDCPVTLEGAPVSNMPDIGPISDIFDADDEIIVDFDTFPVTSSENNVKVYYMISPIPEDDGLIDAVPCWYDDNGTVSINPHAHILSDNGTDIDNRRINGRDYLDTGARVSAIAVEDGCRMSILATEDYHFSEKPAAIVPDEVYTALDELTMPSGSSLNSIADKLPEGCCFSPDEDLTISRKGETGDYVFSDVIYNPDPSVYRDTYISIAIKLTPGIHRINTENGAAYLVKEGTHERISVTQAEARSTIILSANETPEGKEFDRWIVFAETGDEVLYTAVTDDNRQVSLEMPEGEIYAQAVYKDTSGPSQDPVESMTLNISSIDLEKGGEAEITANVTYAEGSADRPPVEFSCAAGILSLTPAGSNTVKVKALGSGSAVVWAVCGMQAVCCRVTVGEEKLIISVMDGRASLPDGRIIEDESVSRGAKVTITANEPENPAVMFKEWDITGANIDKTKNPVSFTITDDVFARAVYTDAEGYEDKGDYPDKKVKVKSLKLTDTVKGKKITGATIALNGSLSVNASAVYYKNAVNRPDIEFRSSNTDVVKVKTDKTGDGKATATIVGCQAGVATVTAFCGNRKARLKITAVEKDIEGIELISDRIEEDRADNGQYRLDLKSGEQELVTVIPNPDDSTAEIKVTWKSDDKKVATVKNGLITARGTDRGRTTVRVTVKSRPYGAKKWITHAPVLIAVNVQKVDTPKKVRRDKSYRLVLSGSKKLDLDAGTINKKGVVSECSISVRVRGKAPASLHWATTNEDIVKITSVSTDGRTAGLKAMGIGTAYITVTGSNETNEALINRAVMKVTVKASAPSVMITYDSLGLISDDFRTLTIKAGSCDRLYYSIITDSPNYRNVSQAPSWSSKGNITVKNGVLYAKKPTKPGKPARVILKSGKSKYTLYVTVN